MPSPFPGIDPYIEGQVWSGIHTQFIAELQRSLVPYLRPRYVAFIEERVYVERFPLQDIFTNVHDRAGYSYSLDYDTAPVPRLSTEDAAWVRERLASVPSAGSVVG